MRPNTQRIYGVRRVEAGVFFFTTKKKKVKMSRFYNYMDVIPKPQSVRDILPNESDSDDMDEVKSRKASSAKKTRRKRRYVSESSDDDADEKMSNRTAMTYIPEAREIIPRASLIPGANSSPDPGLDDVTADTQRKKRFSNLKRVADSAIFSGLFNTIPTPKPPRAIREDEICDYVSLDSLADKLKESEPNITCWGCKYFFGQPSQPGMNKNHDRLWSEYQSHMDRMSLLELYRFVSKLHELLIYIPEVKDGNLQAINWPPDMVRIHLTTHMCDLKIKCKLQIESLEVLKRHLQNKCFYERESDSELVPQVKHIEMLLKLTRELHDSMKSYTSEAVRS